MLKTLTIKDLAIIRDMDLTLSPGLTVITGETGAGKSILLDGLTLISGARADAGLVRVGAERAEVTAEFTVAGQSTLRARLREAEVDNDQDLLLRRVVRAEGSSRMFANGSAVSLANARDFAADLIDIHGQHEFQRLMDRREQLAMLDAFAQHTDELAKVRIAYEQLAELRAKQKELQIFAGTDGELLALLRAQLLELEKATPTAERIALLDSEQRRLAHAESLIQGVAHVLEKLSADEQGWLKQISAAEHDIQRLTTFAPELKSVAQCLAEALIQLGEAESQLQRLSEHLEIDPVKLREVETALSRLHDLARKQRVSLTELPVKYAEMQVRIATLDGAADALQKLEREIHAAEKNYDEAARGLSASRVRAAERLSNAIAPLMAELGMHGGVVAIQLDERDQHERHPAGAETAEWLVSANPGQPPRPLRKVASGGELSRISLAIRVATLAVQDVPVLVFDEVDAGIGGAIADVVGRKLRALAATRQVFCVTHLAQVAACAHQHLRIEKSTSKGETTTRVELLSPSARVEELARMLGGKDVTAATRKLASEMLQMGQR
jgi:DNA repair protein RecN (Recombination protein N)